MELIFATNNQHKLNEIRAILGPEYYLRSLKDIGFADDIEENATTFEGNALLKATHIYSIYNTPCFSDDSGLEVEALDWAPGVYSARYAGEHGNHARNMDRLLSELQGQKNRKAQFRTVICYIDSVGRTHYFEGVIHGVISEVKRGTNGFGYDPLFIPDGHSSTFAEMTDTQKNHISHRAIAVRKFSDFLKQQ